MVFGGFGRFFEELGIFGARQMILWVILLQMHPLTALCDPFGSATAVCDLRYSRCGLRGAACVLVGIFTIRYLLRDAINSGRGASWLGRMVQK